MQTTKTINYFSEGVKEFIETNSDSSKSEKNFIENIKNVDSLKGVSQAFEEYGFFESLKKSDLLLFQDKNIEQSTGREFHDESGYFSEDEMKEILKYLYIQRYVNAHDEDDRDEKNKENMLGDFISDKYDSSVHFFEEILQNIDDAIGRKKTNVTGGISSPEGQVEIIWENSEIKFIYPDRGFSFYDLLAITSLGNSIKKGDIDQASIGEKGIGFKSVFSVATKIHIESKFFGFEIVYDKTRKTSVLQPESIFLPGTGKESSTLTIAFDKQFQIDGENGFKKMLRDWLFENTKGEYLNFSPFLFLKHIGKIIYQESPNSKPENVTIKRSGIQEDENKNFSVYEINDHKYLIYKESLWFNKALIENRWSKIDAIKDENETFAIDRPVEVAFPIINNSESTGNKKGLFYSYLPTEMEIDFPVYINLDVHLKSSRGRISEADFHDGSMWNEHVRDSLAGILVRAYVRVAELYKKAGNEAINAVAEKLYLYIGKGQETNHFFIGQLKDFSNKIKNEAIFLNIADQFVKKEEIWVPNIDKQEDWDDLAAFCLYQPVSGKKEVYSKDFGWHVFIKKESRSYDYYWKNTLLEAYKGIAYFFQNTKIGELKEKDRIIFKVLGVVLKYDNVNVQKDYSVLFVEDKVNKYKICSQEDIEKAGKVLFVRAGNEPGGEDELSVYIAKEAFDDDDYKLYIEWLQKKNITDVKDWTNYCENQLKMMKDDNNLSIYEYVNKLCGCLKYLQEDDIKKLKIPDQIKEKYKKFVLPSSEWEEFSYEEYIPYRKAIARYLESPNTSDKLGYELINLNEVDKDALENQHSKILALFISMGIKADPQIEETTGTYDPLTVKVMPNYSGITTDPNTLEFCYPGDSGYPYLEKPEEIETLQRFLVKFVNDKNNSAALDKEIIKKIFEEKGFEFKKFVFMPEEILNGFTIGIEVLGPRGGYKGESQHKIKSFREAASEDVKYFIGEKEILNLNSGSLMFANIKKYCCFADDLFSKYHWRNPLEKKKEMEEKNRYEPTDYYFEYEESTIEVIINSGPNDALDNLRWIGIWNNVFSVSFAYRTFQSSVHKMSIPEFLSCYRYLEREDIAQLFPDGYELSWGGSDQVQIPDPAIRSEIVEYVRNEFDLEMGDSIFQEYYGHLLKDELVIPLEKYTKMENKDPYKYIIGISNTSNTPKTDYVCRIIETLSGKIDITDVQKLEIADFLDELREQKTKKIQGLQLDFSCYTEAVFRDNAFAEQYDRMMEESGQKLPSVWKKKANAIRTNEDWGMKEWLCEPFETGGYAFQGYGYQCPICGSTNHHHSLSGMKYIRHIKNADPDSKQNLPYLYLVCCLNCADMIERADKVMLRDYDGRSLRQALEHFEKICYCADRFHNFNNSKLKTIKLYLEIDGHDFVEPMKISFLHMVLLRKLFKGDL